MHHHIPYPNPLKKSVPCAFTSVSLLMTYILNMAHGVAYVVICMHVQHSHEASAYASNDSEVRASWYVAA